MVDTVLTKKFSQFVDSGDLIPDEITVGINSGTNAQYNNPWTFLAPGTTGDRPTPAPVMYYRLRLNTTLKVYEYYDPISMMWAELSGSGTGTVNPGSANDIAFYAAAGQAVSPIAAGTNSVLVTDGSQVPSMSTTLPSGLSIPGATITASTAALTAGSVAAAPVAGTDITNKTYVDSLVGGAVTSITGTTNQVIANHPTGAVTLSLPQDIATGSTPTFAGMTLSSIPLGSSSGGTGVNNGSSTLTLGGSLTTSGAFASTFTMTGITNVTFPTSGTLATTAGTVSSITGTANQIAASASTGAVTLSIVSNPILPGTGGFTLPTGNTAARAGGAGTMRFNSQTSVFEATVDGSTWATLETSLTGVLSVSGTTNRITSTGGTTPVIDISASYVGQSSITTLGTIGTGVWNGTNIALANGGTNANLTASNGGIFYSTASAGAILSGTATAQQLLLSGASTTPQWSTSTYPLINAINTLLYASSANVMSALATANNGILVTSSGGVPSISNTVGAGLTMPSITFNTISGIIGTTTNNNAAAGSVGEVISSLIPSGAPVSYTTGSPKNLTSITLTAGDWDVWGNILFNGTTVTQVVGGFSTTTGTLPDSSLYAQIIPLATGAAGGLAVPYQRFSISGSTVVYLVGFVTGSGTLTGIGNIFARRAR
jgi:hypothetical protein